MSESTAVRTNAVTTVVEHVEVEVKRIVNDAISEAITGDHELRAAIKKHALAHLRRILGTAKEP